VTDKPALVGGIAALMRNGWDLPADCNEGELSAHAEMLLNRIQTGVPTEALYSYLAGVQVRSLDMPISDAFKEIVDQSVALVRNSAMRCLEG
jgi:hypothetical protein